MHETIKMLFDLYIEQQFVCAIFIIILCITKMFAPTLSLNQITIILIHKKEVVKLSSRLQMTHSKEIEKTVFNSETLKPINSF